MARKAKEVRCDEKTYFELKRIANSNSSEIYKSHEAILRNL